MLPFPIISQLTIQPSINIIQDVKAHNSTSLTFAVLSQGGYQQSKFSTVERYRLRSGVIWNTNFDINNIY